MSEKKFIEKISFILEDIHFFDSEKEKIAKFLWNNPNNELLHHFH